LLNPPSCRVPCNKHRILKTHLCLVYISMPELPGGVQS
jgi:hypothetical protein